MEHVLRTKIIKFGNNQIHSNKKTYWNLSTTELVEQSILNREGKLSQSGALIVKTGEFT
jgi:ATP-dependent phosphoenolpyruvate carboxykinase